MSVILITGASSGIGKEIAKYFSQKGWKVAATMRNPDAETELQHLPNISLFVCDVLSQSSIDQCVSSVTGAFGQIDVLVNNAGYGAVGPLEAASAEDVRRQFEVNVFGLIAMMQAVIPQMRQRKAGVIINISSMGGRITFPLFSLYHGTKWAIEGLTESLTFELRQFNIRLKLIEPGAIRTSFYDRSMTVFVKPGLTAYDSYFAKTFGKIHAAGATAPGPIVVAKKVYEAATDGSNKLRYPVGGVAPALLILRWMLPVRWFNAIVSSQIE